MGRPRHPLRGEAERLLRGGRTTRDVMALLSLPHSTVASWKAELNIELAHVVALQRSKRNNNAKEVNEERESAEAGFPDPVPLDELCAEALRALEDFGYFRRRYFGRISSPWQEMAGVTIVRYLESDRTEYVVLNCPPEAGKSTLWHDLVCWLICRDRSIRILYLTISGKQVPDYTDLVRDSLTNPFPFEASPFELEHGLAVDAETTLGADFGRFRPADGSLWRIDRFRVEQLPGAKGRRKKEPTVAGYGMDEKYIGHRGQLVLADDINDEKNSKEGDPRDTLKTKWDGTTERRVETGGCLAVVQQKLGPGDISAHCLAKRIPVDQLASDVEIDDDQLTDDGLPRKYHHLKFQAYYPDLDTGPDSLREDAPPWPDGPLLDPRRLNWQKCVEVRHNDIVSWEVGYQQGDVAPTTQLIQEVWAWGGMGLDGVDYPGCEDKRRGWAEIPENLAPPIVSIAMVDPSGVNNWGLMWMLFQPEADLWHVIDIELTPMQGADLIQPDLSNPLRCTGWMPEWQDRSKALGYPITRWIVEYNAAQRHLTKGYDYVNRWRSINSVAIMPHTTGVNKHDPKMGIQATIPPLFRHGKIRIPSRSGNFKSTKLVKQIAGWAPDKKKDTDLVMVTWFPLIHKHELLVLDAPPPIHQNPEFLGQPWWRAMPA